MAQWKNNFYTLYIEMKINSIDINISAIEHLTSEKVAEWLPESFYFGRKFPSQMVKNLIEEVWPKPLYFCYKLPSIGA